MRTSCPILSGCSIREYYVSIHRTVSVTATVGQWGTAPYLLSIAICHGHVLLDDSVREAWVLCARVDHSSGLGLFLGLAGALLSSPGLLVASVDRGGGCLGYG